MNMSVENQSLTEIKLYQEKQLAGHLKYLDANSPFYSELFKLNKISVPNIQTIEDLVNIPTTDKHDFGKRNFDFLCVPKTKIIDYSTTSGTLGRPVTVALTENDLLRLAYNEDRSFTCAGGSAKNVYQLMLTLDRQFMAGMAYFLGIRKMGAAMVRVGPASPQVQWENMALYKPDSVVVVPSFIIKLIEYAELKGIDLNKSGIEKAICIGEPIRDAELNPNALARRIAEKWNIKLFSTYASTEMQTAFTECEHGRGGHLQQDLVIVEILDEQGNQLKAGEYGEVTATTLGVEGMPLLRYRTGDICCFYDEPCPCGRNTIRLSPVIGRKTQMIKYKGTTFYPPAIFDALSLVPEIIDYLVEVRKDETGVEQLTVHIHHIADLAIVEEKVRKTLQARLRVVPAFNFVSAQQIQQLKASEGRKPVSVVFK